MLSKKSISECAGIFSGNSIAKKVKEDRYTGITSGTPYVATKDISKDHIVNYDNGVRIPFADHSKFKVAPKNSVLICAEGGSAGKKVAFNECEDIHFVNKLFCIAPKRGYLGKYIYYFLLSKEFKESFNSLMTGLIGGVSLGKFKSIQLPVMPEADQSRVISLLDEVFASTSQAKLNIRKNVFNAKELFNSAIDKAFENYFSRQIFEKIGDLCGNSPITYGVIKLGEHNESGVPCLRTSNVRKLNIETEGMKLIDQELSEEYSRTILKGGEVLVNVRGTLGGVAVVPSSMKGWNISREVACVPINDSRVLSEYVAYWIASTQGQSWLTRVQKGAAYTGINLSDLRNMPIHIPPLSEQLELVEKLDNLKDLCIKLSKKYTESLREFVSLEESILDRTFSGELTHSKGVAA